MSKIKNAQLEEQALDTGKNILDLIDEELLKDSPDFYKIKELSKTYQIIKPYF